MCPSLAGMIVRLHSPSLDFYVDVTLRNFDGRWLSVADISGDKEIGFGRSAHEALEVSLAPLGHRATTALLACPRAMRVRERGE